MALQDQVDALLAQQGGNPLEDELLNAPVQVYGAMTSSPGANTTFGVWLESGIQAFHKPFSGVNVATAMAYGHHPDQVPINECAAWRLAAGLGSPLGQVVTPCVLWSYHGEPGSLSRRLEGVNKTTEPLGAAPDQCRAAAFFDCLIAQQDRHLGNLRWDVANRRLGLYDHGYSFAASGDYLNDTVFLAWRRAQGAQGLEQWELDALDQVLIDPGLLGLREILLPARADALESRARSMRQSEELLAPGDF
jgi:hypothetical protein